MYVFDQNVHVTISHIWEDFSFSPDSEHIVSKIMSIDPENNWLIQANSDGTYVRSFEHLGDQDQYVQMAWSPNNQIAAFYNEGLDDTRRTVYFIGFNGENFRSTIVHGYDFRAKWAPRGDKIIYSVYDPNNDYLPELWTVKAQGETIGQGRRQLNIQTWPEKCTFSKDNVHVYCGVPNELPRGAGLLPSVADDAPDTIYKINTRTGQTSLVANPVSFIGQSTFTVDQIALTRDEDYLIFADKRFGGVHKIRLK